MNRSMSSSLFLFLLSCCIAYVASTLRVMFPEELRKQFNSPIATALGNYGRIPYGFFTRGKLYYDHPVNSTSEEEENYACKGEQPLLISSQYEYGYYPIFLIHQGNCSYVQMTRNVEQKGGRMALIISSFAETEENIEDEIIPDDGTGRNIYIPTLVISKTDGNKIVQYIQNNTSQDIYFEIDFPTRQSQNVTIDMFLTVGVVDAYHFMSEFQYFYQLIAKNTSFIPHYLTYADYDLYLTDDEVKSNCVAQGKYCLPSYPFPNKKNGKKLVEEGLFHDCVYRTSNDTKDDLNSFFGFVRNYKSQCLSSLDESLLNNCGRNKLSSLGINEKVIKNCTDKAEQKESNTYIDNKILKAHKKLAKAHNINQIPMILVNNEPIYGSLNAPNLFHVVCSSFIDQPQGCKDYYRPAKESSSLSWFQITLIIIATILANVFIIYICRRYIQRKISTLIEDSPLDLHNHIQKAKSDYYALHSITSK